MTKGVKFYVKDSSNGGQFPEAKPVKADMGILIEHNGQRFTLAEDNFGRLVLTSIGGVSLILKPNSSNRVLISAED